jgi:rSAM/selenodomain-associated transferase 2
MKNSEVPRDPLHSEFEIRNSKFAEARPHLRPRPTRYTAILATTVIIPTINEEDAIEASVRSAFTAGAAEVIVADGGSTDRTTRLATAAGARIILSEPIRSRQMNVAAGIARNDCIIFLHADTLLPAAAAAAVEQALARSEFGGFRIAFAERALKLRVAAAMINIRTSLTRCPWGDQAQFIRRDVFAGIGGFREIPIMEDYELALRMRRRGRTAVLPLSVVTSGRRFLTKGVWRTALTNWSIIASYHRGVSPDELARAYRR